jgi:hypothetical protein
MIPQVLFALNQYKWQKEKGKRALQLICITVTYLIQPLKILRLGHKKLPFFPWIVNRTFFFKKVAFVFASCIKLQSTPLIRWHINSCWHPSFKHHLLKLFKYLVAMHCKRIVTCSITFILLLIDSWMFFHDNFFKYSKPITPYCLLQIFYQ